MIGLVERAYAACDGCRRPGRLPRAPWPKRRTACSPLPGGRCRTPSGTASAWTRTSRRSFEARGTAILRRSFPGMVVTVEPGLYHPEHGGVRWENDVLITDTGARVLTTARIIRVP